MEKVAEFINTQRYREALGRLCRLADQAEPDGRRLLDTWQRYHENSAHAVGMATTRFGNSDNALFSSDEIRKDPLLWLQALDEHCHREFSPDSTQPQDEIDDSAGGSKVLPLYTGRGDGARGKQYGNTAFWLKHHRVVPLTNHQGIRVHVAEVPKGYKDWAAQHLSLVAIKIALVHFTDDATTTTSPVAYDDFICDGISDENTRLKGALEHIRNAKHQGAHILVMPELTITPKIRSRIVTELDRLHDEEGENHALSVPFIVLGSFHEHGIEGWHNHAEAVLGLDGTNLFECDKRKSVTVTFPDEKRERNEGLECAPTPLTCIFTSLGLMAMAICKDLFEGEPAAVLASLPLDWLLVPSMSNNLNPHKGAAKMMHDKGGTVVAVANQEMPGSEIQKPGFVHHKTCEKCTTGLAIVTVARTDSHLRLLK